jgi:hypothetical protein
MTRAFVVGLGGAAVVTLYRKENSACTHQTGAVALTDNAEFVLP